jgi:dCTP diphosphatase
MDTDVWQAKIRDFAQDREWEGFHTPKNLTMALVGEAAELMEIFQWLTPDESIGVMSGPQAYAVRDEVADVMTYLLRLVDVLGIDLDQAMSAKSSANAERYTVERSKGSARKW